MNQNQNQTLQQKKKVIVNIEGLTEDQIFLLKKALFAGIDKTDDLIDRSENDDDAQKYKSRKKEYDRLLDIIYDAEKKGVNA